MNIKDFTPAARRAQWPVIRSSITEMAHHHAGLRSLHSHDVYAPQGVIITLSRKGKDVLTGSVGFIEFHEGMHLDALDILRDFLTASKKDVRWDMVSFFKRAVTLRDVDLPIAQLETSKIARYAGLGYKESLAMISRISDRSTHPDEVYKSVLGNTACIKIGTAPAPSAD